MLVIGLSLWVRAKRSRCQGQRTHFQIRGVSTNNPPQGMSCPSQVTSDHLIPVVTSQSPQLATYGDC